MNERFAAIYDRLIDREESLGEPLEQLRHIGDFSDDLLQAMQDQLRAKNWTALSRLVHVLFLTANRKFTPLLCDLLDNYRYDGYMEEIADVLIDIKDERAVPAMIRALDYDLWSDQDSHFNRKLIVALTKIGTKEAIDGIKLACKSPKALVREEAEDALKSLQSC